MRLVLISLLADCTEDSCVMNVTYLGGMRGVLVYDLAPCLLSPVTPQGLAPVCRDAERGDV